MYTKYVHGTTLFNYQTSGSFVLYCKNYCLTVDIAAISILKKLIYHLSFMFQYYATQILGLTQLVLEVKCC